jgi:chromosomal replication initiator protein
VNKVNKSVVMVPGCHEIREAKTAEELWSSARVLLRQMLNGDIYNLWFAPIVPKALEGDCLTLEVANDFCEVWLNDNYLQLIQEVIAHASGQQYKIRFQIAAAVAAPVPAPATAVRRGAREQVLEGSSCLHDLGFNPKNTFDTFVVGNNNNFAHAAALAVAQSPGRSYNPLFVYGGVGLGKTHLLHAIGQYVTGHQRACRVAYVSSEKFTNEYIDAIQNNQLVRFRQAKYRQTDVLLIDDIQFLSGKERIQEEFFHTFNALHENHKQIVLTCDRPAAEIQNLEQRLGLAVRMGFGHRPCSPRTSRPVWRSCARKRNRWVSNCRMR